MCVCVCTHHGICSVAPGSCAAYRYFSSTCRQSSSDSGVNPACCRPTSANTSLRAAADAASVKLSPYTSQSFSIAACVSGRVKITYLWRTENGKLCCVVLCCVVLRCVVLLCAPLCCAVLCCCVALCYTVLCTHFGWKGRSCFCAAQSKSHWGRTMSTVRDLAKFLTLRPRDK